MKRWLVCMCILGMITFTGCGNTTEGTKDEQITTLVAQISTAFSQGYKDRDTAFLQTYADDVDVPTLETQLNTYFTRFSSDVLTFDAKAYYTEFYSFDSGADDPSVEDAEVGDADVVDVEEPTDETTTQENTGSLDVIPYSELRFNTEGIAYVIYNGILMEVPFDYITPSVELLELAPRYYFTIEDMFVKVDARGTGTATVFLKSRYDNAKIRIDYSLKKGKILTMDVKS